MDQGVGMAELLSRVAASSHAVVQPWTTARLHDLLASFDLGSHGITAQSRVALYLPNGPLAATVLLATMTRYCAVPLDPQEPAAAIAARLAKSRVRCLVSVPGLSDAAQAAAAAASLPLIILEPAPLMPRGGFFLPQPTVAAATACEPEYNAPDDIVLLLHTSGTTGEPRRVRHTLPSLLAAARALAESLALSPDDVGLNMMPMHHIGGITCMLAPLHAGARMLFCARFDPVEWWRLVSMTTTADPSKPSSSEPPAVTWCYAVPAMWKAILSAASRPPMSTDAAAQSLPKQQQRGGHSLRLVRSGGAALPHATAVQLREALGARVVVLPTYSMSECMPVASPPCGYALERPGSVGPACGGGITLHVLREDGGVAPAGHVGAVAIGASGGAAAAAAQLFAGYDDDDDDGAAEFDVRGPEQQQHMPLFLTGDLGWLDDDGWLYLTGRASEAIQRGGETICPGEVEAAIASHPALLAIGAEVLAFAAPHDDLGEVVGIAIQQPRPQPQPQPQQRPDAAAEGGSDAHLALVDADSLPLPSLAELREWAAASLSAAQLPQMLVLTLGPLPRTAATQKLQRAGLATRVGVPRPCTGGRLVTCHQHRSCGGTLVCTEASDGTTTDDDVLARVRRALPASAAVSSAGGSVAVGLSADELDAPLAELGVDSLQLMRLSAELSAALGVRIPPALQHATPTTLRALVERAQAAASSEAARTEGRRRGSPSWFWQQRPRPPPRRVQKGEGVPAVSPAQVRVSPADDDGDDAMATASHGKTETTHIMLRSRHPSARRGATLLNLAARDEQLLLAPLSHLYSYPAFCYVLQRCPDDADARLQRGLQACLDGAYAFLAGRVASSRHAVIDVGEAGGVPFRVVTDDASVLAALEAALGGTAEQQQQQQQQQHLQLSEMEEEAFEGPIVAAAADLRSPAECWRGWEALMTVTLHRFTGRSEAVLAVSRAHAVLDGVGYGGFVDAWARAARGEGQAGGSSVVGLPQPQPGRRAGVPGRPWGLFWRQRRAEALMAEDEEFCAELRSSSVPGGGSGSPLPSRLLVELPQADLEELRRFATPQGEPLVTTQEALTAHLLLALLSFAPLPSPSLSSGVTTASNGQRRVRVGVLMDGRRFLKDADAFGNWYFSVYVCWTMGGLDSNAPLSAEQRRQQLIQAASAIARGLGAVDSSFAAHALSHSTFLRAKKWPSLIQRAVDRMRHPMSRHQTRASLGGGDLPRNIAERDARRALATRNLGGGVSIGHEWMTPSQLMDASVDLNVEMNIAAAELPTFGPPQRRHGEGAEEVVGGDTQGVATMQASACLTARPEWLRQVMCLPREGGGVVLCIPDTRFGGSYHVERRVQLRAALHNVATYRSDSAGHCDGRSVAAACVRDVPCANATNTTAANGTHATAAAANGTTANGTAAIMPDDAHRHRYDWALEALDSGQRQRTMIIGDDREERFWHPGHLRSHWPGHARVAYLLLHLAWRSAREGDDATARMILRQPRRCWLVLSLVRAQSTVSDESMLSILRGSWVAGAAAVRETATQRGLYLTWERQLQLQQVYERTRPDVVLQCGDKLLLARFLQTRGVPTPRTFALRYGRWQTLTVRVPDAVQPGGQFVVAAPAGRMVTACPLTSKPGDAIVVMAPESGPEELPRRSLFVKPTFLDGGRGIEAYEWREANDGGGHGDGGGDGDGDGGGDGGGAFVAESSGETVSREELWQRLAPPSSAGELLVQEWLRNALP